MLLEIIMLPINTVLSNATSEINFFAKVMVFFTLFCTLRPSDEALNRGPDSLWSLKIQIPPHWRLTMVS